MVFCLGHEPSPFPTLNIKSMCHCGPQKVRPDMRTV